MLGRIKPEHKIFAILVLSLREGKIIWVVEWQAIEINDNNITRLHIIPLPDVWKI